MTDEPIKIKGIPVTTKPCGHCEGTGRTADDALVDAVHYVPEDRP